MEVLADRRHSPWQTARHLMRLVAVWICFGVSQPRALPALPEPMTEAEVKADYIITFSKYVEWPEGALAAPDKPIVIGVLGDEGMSDALERRVVGRTTQGGRKLSVLRARKAADLSDCNLVFVGQGERRNLREILEAIGPRAALSVCDSDSLFNQGIMIKFALMEGKVRFEVKLDPVKRANLTIPSGMLGAAKRVWPMTRSSLEPP